MINQYMGVATAIDPFQVGHVDVHMEFLNSTFKYQTHSFVSKKQGLQENPLLMSFKGRHSKLTIRSQHFKPWIPWMKQATHAGPDGRRGWSLLFLWGGWPKKSGVVVSNIFYFPAYLGKMPILTNIFQMGWNHQLERDPDFKTPAVFGIWGSRTLEAFCYKNWLPGKSKISWPWICASDESDEGSEWLMSGCW